MEFMDPVIFSLERELEAVRREYSFFSSRGDGLGWDGCDHAGFGVQRRGHVRPTRLTRCAGNEWCSPLPGVGDSRDLVARSSTPVEDSVANQSIRPVLEYR